MIGLKELELRLLDERKNVFLVVPIIAGSEKEALIAAQAHMEANQASGFDLVPQKASAGYRPLRPNSNPR
jgi:hypothetical protein